MESARVMDIPIVDRMKDGDAFVPPRTHRGRRRLHVAPRADRVGIDRVGDFLGKALLIVS